ncbi:MAG: hypothetical protein FH761_12485 [Firmicutes bacterium]|nr:hypothetical protein [Bacillota bacterium]
MKTKYIKIFVFLFLITLLSGLLLFKPFIGLADNADYFRVIQPLGLEINDYQKFFYFYNEYDINLDQGNNIFEYISNVISPSIPNEEEYVSTQFLIIKVAMILNIIVKSIMGLNNRIFDIRFLAIVYIIIYGISLYYIYMNLRIKKAVHRIIAFGLMIFMFCDIGYIIYFNSFFGEATIITSLFMMIAMTLWIIKNKSPNLPSIMSFYIAAFIFVGAKVANSPMGILIAIFGLSFILLKKDLKIRITISVLSIALIITSMHFYTKSPDWMRKVTNYHSIFFGVLKDSPTPEEDLRDLGISEEYLVLKDTHGYLYHNGYNIYSDEFKEAVYDNASHFEVLKFYLKHPTRFIDKLKITAESSIMMSPPYLGNYRKVDYIERLKLTNRFSAWSYIRKQFVGSAFLIIILLFILFACILIYELIKWIRSDKKSKSNLVSILGASLLFLIAGSQFAIPIIGNGEADIVKHMYLFNACFDFMIFLGIIWLLVRVSQLNIKKYVKVNVDKKALITIISAIAIIISIPPIINIAKVDDNVDIGDTIKFGTYNQESIDWKVINYNENVGYLLWSDEIVEINEFDHIDENLNDDMDNYGSNLWATSDIRQWLNQDKSNGFLTEFTQEEKNAILSVNNRNVLSAFDLDRKDGGSRPHYWINITSIADQNYEQAYYMTSNDKVFLLDIHQLVNYVFENNIRVNKYFGYNNKKVKMKYWLRTPYYSSSSMVRIVDTDGLIYHKDANVKNIAVIPAIYITDDIKIVGGKGTEKSPYEIRIK